MVIRRHFLGTAGAGAALVVFGLSLSNLAEAAGVDLPPGLAGGFKDVAAMEALPGKKSLIRLCYRPPNYESPLAYFRTPITPNDQFLSITASRGRSLGVGLDTRNFNAFALELLTNKAAHLIITDPRDQSCAKFQSCRAYRNVGRATHPRISKTR